MTLLLFLGIIFAITSAFAIITKKTSIHWIFIPLIIGMAISSTETSKLMLKNEIFTFIAKFGMLLLLFLIGLEINFKIIKKHKNFIIKSTFFIIFFEALLGSIFIYLIFHYSIFISLIVSLSFATVGEVILIPILEKFKITKTRLSQALIGIGVFDDIIEILILIVVGIFIGTQSYSTKTILLMSASLAIIFLIFKITPKIKQIKNPQILLVSSISALILFSAIGELFAISALSSILAGMLINTLLKEKDKENLIKQIKNISYGFFAPIFFLWIGMSINLNYLISSPLLILAITLISALAKIVSAKIVSKKTLNKKESLLLGIGLSARFSTSIIIIKMLLENNIIDNQLYSIIIASSIIFTIAIPFIFSKLITKWKIKKA